MVYRRGPVRAPTELKRGPVPSRRSLELRVSLLGTTLKPAYMQPIKQPFSTN